MGSVRQKLFFFLSDVIKNYIKLLDPLNETQDFRSELKNITKTLGLLPRPLHIGGSDWQQYLSVDSKAFSIM